MFTGLVESKGVVRSRTAEGPGARLEIGTSLTPLVLGESISVDGVCLTVDAITPQSFFADASKETLDRTTLGKVSIGSNVNLERAIPLGGRMGGHIVTGHVDAPSHVVRLAKVGNALKVDIALPPPLARYVAEKGSITVNGVSLTVNGVGPSAFDVLLIPRTQSETTLESLREGSLVNLEVDVLARYAERLLASTHNAVGTTSDDAWMKRLETAGYL